MSKHLLSTIQGDYKQVELTNNGGVVQNVSIWRHAGDSEQEITDSWFVEAMVSFVNSDGDKFCHPFHLRCHDYHGRPKAQVALLAAKILEAGVINMKHWRCGNITDRY